LARKQKKIALTAAAKILGVSQPTLSAWEGERKNPSVDSLIQMSELYGVSVDFLLGLSEEQYHRADLLQPILPEALPAFHETPVFSSRYGWAMVDAIVGELLFASGMRLPLADAADLYALPPTFAIPGTTAATLLRKVDFAEYDSVWVEPISMDAVLRNELRGWYQVKKHFVENEVGQRFYFDFYGSKWLAFANGPGNV
jgi:transcriptional regulator with XRE-family HTH domain